jgi:hypothetical protein
VKTGVIRARRDSSTYIDTNVPFGFHVAQPLPVFTPAARYW